MADVDGQQLVFLVGAPRSGTTYLQRLIASHPQVRTGQESDVFDLYVGPLLRTWKRELAMDDGRGGVGLACYLREAEFRAIVKRFLLDLLSPMLSDLGEGELFLEKTPSHALFIPEILELLPKARFIHILRDARDVVASLLAASRTWGRHWAPRTAWRAAWLWARHVEAVEAAKPLIPCGHFLEVRYEALRNDPVGVLREVADFLRLEWSDEAIRLAVERNTPDRVRRGRGTPIPKKGEFAARTGPIVLEPADFVRRGEAGGWRRDLRWFQKVLVWVVAGKTMQRVGYTSHAGPLRLLSRFLPDPVWIEALHARLRGM